MVIALLALASRGDAQSIFTVAGGGSADGRPATTASLNQARGLGLDAAGNVYIADTENHRVRRVSASNGVISTIAGNGSGGNAGDGGPATQAGIQQPSDVAVDRLGNIYITDHLQLRRVDAASGVITSYSDVTGEAVVVDESGFVYVANGFGVRRVDATGAWMFVAGDGGITSRGDGIPATSTAVFAQDVAIDRAGNLYIAEFPGEKIRKVDGKTGIITTIAGGGTASGNTNGLPATSVRLFAPNGVTVDDAGNVYFSENNASRVQKVDRDGRIFKVAGGCTSCALGDGGPATLANISRPTDVAVDAAGNLYLVGGQRVRKVDASGTIATIAGTGGAGYQFTGDNALATNASLNLGPGWSIGTTGVALDRDRNLYIADPSNHRVRKVDAATRKITTIAGDGRDQFGEDGIPATASSVSSPRGIAVDSRGNVYVATYYQHRIRKIDPVTGIITTVAGNGTFAYGGDGGPATLATLYYPSALAVDASDNLYIADSLSNRVRKIDAKSGIITSIANASVVRTLALDAAGNVYFAGDGSRTVYRFDPRDGTTRLVAGTTDFFPPLGDGGPATAARIDPSGLAVSASGDLYISDGSRVRKVDAASGIITTFAGSRAGGFFGDGGAATQAGLLGTSGLAIDSAGNLYIAEMDNNRIRFVPKCVAMAPPGNLSPSNGSSGVPTFPRLAWSAIEGAFHYDVLLDTVNPPARVAAADLAANTFSPSNLAPLTTYSWRVIAKGDPFCTPLSTAASNVQSFTTSASCEPPGIP